MTCLYRGLTDGSFAADLEALGNSTDFAPGVLMAWLMGGLDFMLGAVMATTKRHLAEIGGFESLVDYFCDDYELGNRIAARGYRIELSRSPVAVVYPRETLAERLSPSASLEFEHPLFAALGASGTDFHAGAGVVTDRVGSGTVVVARMWFYCRLCAAAHSHGSERRSARAR